MDPQDGTVTPDDPDLEDDPETGVLEVPPALMEMPEPPVSFDFRSGFMILFVRSKNRFQCKYGG